MLAPSVLCYSTQSISATGSEAHEVCFDRLLLGLCSGFGYCLGLGCTNAALGVDGAVGTSFARDTSGFGAKRKLGEMPKHLVAAKKTSKREPADGGVRPTATHRGLGS